MKRIILFLVVMALGQTATAQTKNFIDQPYMETSATVDTLVVPDKIYLAILITEADSKGKVSTETLERRMYNTLTGLGIDTKEKLKLSNVGSVLLVLLPCHYQHKNSSFSTACWQPMK